MGGAAASATASAALAIYHARTPSGAAATMNTQAGV